jgi:lipid-binding SYLF domain-containing protein
LQIGAGETDVVFMVMNQAGMNRLEKDKFTVGGDASVMAGPVGRSARAETDAAMRAEILAYSRSRGVFGGITLQGATLRPDNDDNEKIYGQRVTQMDLIQGKVKPTADDHILFDELNMWAPVKKG